MLMRRPVTRGRAGAEQAYGFQRRNGQSTIFGASELNDQFWECDVRKATAGRLPGEDHFSGDGYRIRAKVDGRRPLAAVSRAPPRVSPRYRVRLLSVGPPRTSGQGLKSLRDHAGDRARRSRSPRRPLYHDSAGDQHQRTADGGGGTLHQFPRPSVKHQVTQIRQGSDESRHRIAAVSSDG